MANKSNKQFMILSAIGIVMVVDAHSWSVLNLMTSIFPYNSFFMPMFIFISGYFFCYNKQKGFWDFCSRKISKLLKPYFVWTLIYGLLVTFLKKYTPIHYGKELDVYTFFIGPWVSGELFDINNPSWFVPTLFLVSLAYFLIRKVFDRLWNQLFFLGLFIFIGAGSVLLASKGYNQFDICMPLLKVSFLLQFYQLGVWYRERGEAVLNRISREWVLAFVILVNITCIFVYRDIRYSPMRMSGGGSANCFLPLITSVSGIIFWLSVSEVLVPILGESKVCNYISDHTFQIMMHHVAFMVILNWGLVLLSRFIIIPDLDITAIKATAWYRYCPYSGFYIFYFAIGLGGALLLCRVQDYWREKINKVSKRLDRNLLKL